MRFVVDEESLDCDEASEQAVRDVLEGLLDVMSSLREDGEDVGLISGWGGINCWRDADVAAVLTAENPLSRDEGVLLLGLLGKGVAIDDEADELDPDVEIDGLRANSYGVSFAHSRVRRGCGMAAVVGLQRNRRGVTQVLANGGKADVVLVAVPNDCLQLWRSLFAVEDIREADFFDVATRAFPVLYFAPTLNFGSFAGGYAVRDAVVAHLCILNDDWQAAYVAEKGNSARISARIGIDVSIEGTTTRSSEKKMKLRDVEFRGETYRCEWHSKLEWNKNRIHFYPADPRIDRPLIGIFCDHLAT